MHCQSRHHSLFLSIQCNQFNQLLFSSQQLVFTSNVFSNEPWFVFCCARLWFSSAMAWIEWVMDPRRVLCLKIQFSRSEISSLTYKSIGWLTSTWFIVSTRRLTSSLWLTSISNKFSRMMFSFFYTSQHKTCHSLISFTISCSTSSKLQSGLRLWISFTTWRRFWSNSSWCLSYLADSPVDNPENYGFRSLWCVYSTCARVIWEGE